MAGEIKITFVGGTETVTGSNFLITDGSKKILIDCGLFQGSKIADERNRDAFPYDPKTIDALIVTHAHIDHVGRIPILVKNGFKGIIYSTPPTKDLARDMMADSMGVLHKQCQEDGQPDLYDQEDVNQAMKLWQGVPYHQLIELGNFKTILRDAGHILGSAMVEFTYAGKKIIFTGDLGNTPAPLLKDTEKITDANYLIMESVYGDRNHETHEERKAKLEDAIEDTMKRGGTLMIPAFSLERTQDILFEIERMMEGSRIPLVPVIVDSPLAIKITATYQKYTDYFNKDVNKEISEGHRLFNFPQVHLTPATDDSKAIKTRFPGRKIIMAGSGMSNGGRILHHEKEYLPDPKSTLLLVGYQAAGSLGRILQDGAKQVKIFGEHIPVNARVVSIHGYSAHKDSDHLFQFVQDTADTLKKVYVVIGEPKSALFLVQRLRDNLGIDAVSPKAGETVTINL